MTDIQNKMLAVQIVSEVLKYTFVPAHNILSVDRAGAEAAVVELLEKRGSDER